MVLLVLFAIIAGAGTAVTPCVLPVLPAILSAGGAGGRRRPVGIVTGLAAAFTVAIVAVAQLVRGVGLASGATRGLAVVVLIVFGAIMLVPGAAARIQAPLSRLGRFGPKDRGDGFLSGLAVGAALGFVCAPCAGPILAAVTSVSATRGASLRVVFVALGYAAGLSAVLLVYALGGRALIARIKRGARGHLVERALGAVLLLTGIAMAANLDVRFEEALARSRTLPSFLLDPTRGLETSGAVQNRLASLRPGSRFANPHARSPSRSTGTPPGAAVPDLADLGAAPDFAGTQRWFNTPGGRPLTLAGLRGHVVLVDFWTYTCINCIRTLPFVEGLYANYRRAGLVVVGVHTPEFAFEHDAGNVADAIHADGLTYPVAQDNDYATWNAYGNQYWPAEYLIDARGRVRHTQFGEGDYSQSEAAVRALLREAGTASLPAPMTARAQSPSADLATPETYLDAQRSRGFAQPLDLGSHVYSAPSAVQPGQFALDGPWRVSNEGSTPAGAGASIRAGVQAADVYLVMTSEGGASRRVGVLLDGRRVPAQAGGRDVRGGVVVVRSQRLYHLIHLPRAERHALTVEVPPGVSAYSFTFG